MASDYIGQADLSFSFLIEVNKRTDRIYGFFPVYMLMPFMAEYAKLKLQGGSTNG
jgi:hypothetical protein